MTWRFLSSYALTAGLMGVAAVGCGGDSDTSAAPPSAASSLKEAAAPKEAAPQHGTPEAKPLLGDPICNLTGQAGQSVDCAVRLSADPDGLLACALQGTLAFDPDGAEFVGFFDRTCPPAGECFDRLVTPEAPALSATGHVLSVAPDKAEEWRGEGRFLLAHFGAPTTPLSSARVGTDAAAEVLRPRFRLKRDADARNPVVVRANGVVAADAAAREVSAAIVATTIVTGGAR